MLAETKRMSSCLGAHPDLALKSIKEISPVYLFVIVQVPYGSTYLSPTIKFPTTKGFGVFS
jgi:hypothetical protein